MSATTIKKMPLRFFGSKWRIAPWIIQQFPKHKCYVEPFAGGAGVLLQKPESRAEILNDLDQEVHNFWTVLRKMTKRFIREITLTPFSRHESNIAFERIAVSPLERARRFYVRAWQLRAGPTAKWRSGWRHSGCTNRNRTISHDFAKTDHLWDVVERLKKVQLECDDAFKVIPRYDQKDTLFYVDPPYVSESRTKWAFHSYRHEMTVQDHERLADLLHDVDGRVVLSGYDSKLYAKLYKGWKVMKLKVRNVATTAVEECLWIK